MAIEPGEVILGLAFFGTVGYTVKAVSGAWAQRALNRAAPRVAADEATRIARIEHAVESIALEVERISEGQRFTTKLLAERGNNGSVPTRSDRAAGTNAVRGRGQ